MTRHQQPSFKFKTNIENYECVYVDHIGGDVHWEVKVIYSSSEKLTAAFIAPSSGIRDLNEKLDKYYEAEKRVWNRDNTYVFEIL